MDIERLGGNFAHSFDYRETERYIRHEHTVHHVDVDESGGTLIDHHRVAAEVIEVGRKYRGGYNHYLAVFLGLNAFHAMKSTHSKSSIRPPSER